MKWLRRLLFGNYFTLLEQENERAKAVINAYKDQLEYKDHNISELRHALESENLRADMAEANYKQIVGGNDALVAKIKGMKS